MSRGLVKNVLRRLPVTSKIVRRRDLRRRFATELALLGGGTPSASNRRSIFLFTAHKCASVYVGSILHRLAQESGMMPVDFEGYLYLAGRTQEDLERIDGHRRREVYHDRGYLYGPFRDFFIHGAPPLEDFLTILHLRDPRDVLTSYYFTIAFSHSAPAENPEEAEKLGRWRDDAQKKSIDDFVLDQSDLFLSRYQTYCDRFVGRPGVLLVKYEEMVGDFEAWLDALVRFAGFRVGKDTHGSIIASADFEVEKENVHSHRRQVTPGDHRRKLKPGTIDALNRKFRKVLDTLNYIT